MRTLDRGRAYGVIYPSGLFEQDGVVFDRDGNEMTPPTEAAPVVIEWPVAEDELPEARKIDLRLKQNAHLRPSARKAAAE